jgi:hypothetical protein
MIRRTPWAQQPQIPAGVNWANPASRDLRVLITPVAGKLREVCLGSLPTADTSTPTVKQYGTASAYSNQQTTLEHQSQYDVLGDLTIIAIVTPNSLTNYSAVISKQSNPSINTPYELRLGSAATDGNVNFLRANSGYLGWQASTSSVVSAGSRSVIAVTQGPDITVAPTFVINGTTYAGNLFISTGVSGAPTTALDPIYIGRRADNITFLDGSIQFVAVWARILSAFEIASIAANPWQLFAPLTRQFPGSANADVFYPIFYIRA